MTTRELDRRDRSTQITLLASTAAGVVLAAFVAFTAFGGGGQGRGNDGGAVVPTASPSPTAPVKTPEPAAEPTGTPVPTAAPSGTPVATPDSNDGGSDAMPIKVDLQNATGADGHVDIADTTGLLVDAGSGTPGDGMSVEPYTLKVENLDATTLRLTWADFPIDNALPLYIDESDGASASCSSSPSRPARPMRSASVASSSSRSRSPSRRTRSRRSSRTGSTRPADLSALGANARHRHRSGRAFRYVPVAATKCGRSVAQPPWLRSRQLSPLAPSASQPRCSISTRVVASPRSMNWISTSVASARSSRRCHR